VVGAFSGKGVQTTGLMTPKPLSAGMGSQKKMVVYEKK
jgi:hypothetical protein